jgi:hypothetical protein
MRYSDVALFRHVCGHVELDDLLRPKKIRTEKITIDFVDEECRIHYREGFRRLAEILRAILCGTKKTKLQKWPGVSSFPIYVT